jgi:hypothetical protein
VLSLPALLRCKELQHLLKAMGKDHEKQSREVSVNLGIPKANQQAANYRFPIGEKNMPLFV